MDKLIVFWNKNKFKILIVLGLLVFSSSLFNFFSADDWFHLRVVQIDSFKQFLNFFSFFRTDESISFYRPLSTQVFFFIFYKLFGLNSFFYFLAGLIIFGLICSQLTKLLRQFKVKEEIIFTTLFVYVFSASNFARLNFVSAFQELFLGLFMILAVRYFLNKKWYFLIFWILALLSKETAIVFLPLMIVVDLIRKKKLFENIKYYLLVGLISVIYLGLRFFIFRGANGESYIWDFSIKKALNTTMWYGLWSIGIPEFMVDYVGSGLKIIPKFFGDFGIWAKIFLGEIIFLFTTIVLTKISGLKQLKNKSKNILVGVLIFGTTLLPVIFMPWHKYSHALTLPLIGIAIVLAEIYQSNKNKFLKIFFVISFLMLNITSIYFLNKLHYSTTRGVISQKVFEYFEQNYPNYPENKSFVFINDTNPEAKQWGSSKQIAYALSNSDFFKVFYKDKNIKVYYEDLDQQIPTDAIKISSKMFLE